MAGFWMVRARDSIRFFEGQERIAIRWDWLGDLSAVADRDALGDLYRANAGVMKSGRLALGLATVGKFLFSMSPGDAVLTYDKESREYLYGEVVGDYEFRADLNRSAPHTRRVAWKGRVSRDDLGTGARNTLGSGITIFQPGAEVEQEIRSLLAGTSGGPRAAAATEPDVIDFKEDLAERAHEFIKDAISALDWDELQELVAAVLRAMGYKTRVSPKGSDQGKDITASPDGLGLEPPRIKVEVKHRLRSSIGAPDLRSFLGGLRGEDRGLYVSTGGFSREAIYEAERATVPVTLMTLDDLAALLVQHYERMDAEGRALVPLTRVYWPA